MINILKENKQRYLSIFLLVLFALQPVLDVLSYWLIALDKSTTLTLLLRMAMFAVTALVGFLVSKRKWIYFAVGGGLAVFWVIHYLNCCRIGYPGLLTDISNYVRVIQMPVFVLAFLSIFQYYNDSLPPVSTFAVVNYGIILLVILVSVVTGTDPHSYDKLVIRVKGWFYNGNTQTAIIAMLIPVVMYAAYHSKKKWFFAAVTAVGFANLFFTGTRIAYYSIFIIAAGFLFGLIINKCKAWLYYAIPLALAVVCAACYTFSPMYDRMTRHSSYVADKQEEVDQPQPTNPTEKPPEEYQDQPSTLPSDELEEYRALYSQMPRYQPIIRRFGLSAVLEKLDYTTDISKLSDARLMKNTYNFLLFERQDIITQLFGMHYNMELYFDNYDTENDILSLLFLYGYIGLALYALFAGGFILYFAVSVFRSFKKVCTLEFACIVSGLAVAVVTLLFTAGMLRRPSASFYLSLYIAYGSYLINQAGIWKKKGRTLPLRKK